MATIRFNVKPVANKKMQIRALFQDGKSQTTKNTGYSIPAAKLREEYKYWDNTKQLVRGQLENQTTINSLIEQWRSDFTTYKDDCKRLNKPVDIELFKRILDGEEILTESPSLISVAKKFITSIKSTHKGATRSGYQVVINDLEKYEKEKKKTVMLHEVDRTFYKDFSVYLIEKENNYNPTLNKKQTKLVTIMNYACDDLKIKGLTNDFKKKYRFKEVQAGKFPLHPEELATLWNRRNTHNYNSLLHALEVAKTKLEQLSADVSKEKEFATRGDVQRARMALYHMMVLDAFLLACETGLRHSDVAQLQAPHIKTHIAAEGMIQFIDLTNIKGSKDNNTALSAKAIEIIERYTKPEGYLFRFDYSQSTSRILKAIFEHQDVNLNRPCEVVQTQGSKTIRTMVPLHDIISFHMGRNTYATRLLSSKDLAPAHVMGNLGHSKIDITMGYFRNDDVTRWQETLKVLNKK